MSKMNSTILRKDTYICADEERGGYIIYSPFANIIARTNRFPCVGGRLEMELIRNGFFQGTPNTTYIRDNSNGFTSLTLLLTKRCNLKCIYCYASPNIDGESMSRDLVLNSIRWFIQQNKKLIPKITFHGAGEPTLEQGLIKEAVSLTESIKGDHIIKYLIVTNGTCDKGFIDWMMSYRFAITISADGPPEIQNRNRPFADGTPSSLIVESNIRYIIDKNYPVGIRLTYSGKDDLNGIVKYFGELGVRKIHLEPLFPYGRYYDQIEFGHKSKYDIFSPEARVLVDKFIEAMEVCSRYGMKIYNGHLVNFMKGMGYYCGGISGSAMIVRTDGVLTGCLEVVDSKDPITSVFDIGNLVNDKIRLDQSKIYVLKQRHTDILPFCKTCFARYTCAGGCAVKAIRTGQGVTGRDISYCQFTRLFVPILIKRIATLSNI